MLGVLIVDRMRYVAAYLLAVLGGNASPSQDAIEKILSSVGVESDADRVKKIIAELTGKSIDDLIAQGKKYYNFFNPMNLLAASNESNSATGSNESIYSIQ